MKVTADTNVLLRAYLADDDVQSPLARDILVRAEVVAISLQTLCELVWVLSRQLKASRADIVAAIRELLNTDNAAVNRPAVEAGLAVMEAGGDFADGIVAFEGRWLGGETFVSFDRKAVRLLAAQGHAAEHLS